MKKTPILIILFVVLILAVCFDIFLRLQKDGKIVIGKSTTIEDTEIVEDLIDTENPADIIEDLEDTSNEVDENIETNEAESVPGLHISTSIDDDMIGNSLWCGTFQLVWNDLIDEIVKQDVVFHPQLQIVENLNKKTFSNEYISPDSYFSKFGLLTLDLKEEIENWIKEKFDETSDILDLLDWSDVPQSDEDYDLIGDKRYWFYAMLKKIFNFETVFDELDVWKFDDKYDNVEYFWINWDSDNQLYKQVYVYYYNSDDDFAVALQTKEWEEIRLARWADWKSLLDIYKDILVKKNKYEWNYKFTEFDYLKVPNLKTKTLTEFKNLENHSFSTASWESYLIGKALQAIEFELNKSGWYIKSEAWVDITKSASAIMPQEIEHRYFYFDKPFVMFWKETDKNLPYFAAQISDITLFQE